MPRKNFVRQDSTRYSKLGKRRRKLQKWRRPKGRDSKMNEKRYSYPRVVNVGYKGARKESGKVAGMKPALVYNIKDLEKIARDKIAIIGKVGAKKRIGLIKRAKEMQIKMHNVRDIEGVKHAA